MKNQQFYVKTARLAVPIMMQNMITIGVNMADNIMVGSLGENALSAVALANQFINIYQFSCMGLGQGASIMTSRFWGMKNEKALKQTDCDHNADMSGTWNFVYGYYMVFPGNYNEDFYF